MKMLYQTPSTEVATLSPCSIVLTSPPAPIPNGGNGDNIGGD